jgi:signal transduction histidine kinase
LSTTVEHLQLAQSELVRSEKLASLGSLVAGVAHELNTPIGNGVMAVSTMRGALKSFRERSAEGLKRSLLDSFVEAVETGSLIAERNLERAAELVTSFKQVAADQTTSQRREFRLDEVVHEIALTLGPSLRHSVAQLSLDIPDNIRMESYPGPLGQIITNLITNATVHAFPDRDQGHIRLHAKADDRQVQIWVSDDGRHSGQPAAAHFRPLRHLPHGKRRYRARPAYRPQHRRQRAGRPHLGNQQRRPGHHLRNRNSLLAPQPQPPESGRDSTAAGVHRVP